MAMDKLVVGSRRSVIALLLLAAAVTFTSKSAEHLADRANDLFDHPGANEGAFVYDNGHSGGVGCCGGDSAGGVQRRR
jgi:hypothetical protein